MAGTQDSRSDVPKEAAPAAREPIAPMAPARQHAGSTPSPATATSVQVTEAAPPAHSRRKLVLWAVLIVGLAVGVYFLIPWIKTALTTISTDDAYVNSHVTFVAPRVAGQVIKVLVDDNYRVQAGDLLVQLDKEPYQVQLEIKKAALATAQADLVAANAKVRAAIGQARANRYKLEHAMEEVKNQIANLRAAVATLKSRQATLELARANLKRGQDLVEKGGISKEDLDQRREAVKVDEAAVDQALQTVYAIRVGLGLSEQPPSGELGEVKPNLDQTFSAVRQALGELMQSAAQFGYFASSFDAGPKEVIDEFYKKDPEGKKDIDRIFESLIPKAPAIQQAKAKLLQAESDLDQAKLNLRYCDVVSEIDGVVTRRNVNPGNNVQVGQSLMAVRSLTEIWIDCNFKETQLADLRIGHRVRCEVDMYGSRREYEGRITGFTMGTGESLALLPPQNATGNFVKIVQRLPVRVELTDYDPDKEPLFVGLSVVPYIYYKEPPTGPNAGAVLQPFAPLPKGPTQPKS